MIACLLKTHLFSRTQNLEGPGSPFHSVSDPPGAVVIITKRLPQSAKLSYFKIFSDDPNIMAALLKPNHAGKTSVLMLLDSEHDADKAQQSIQSLGYSAFGATPHDQVYFTSTYNDIYWG